MLSSEASFTWVDGFTPADHRYVRESLQTVRRRAGHPGRFGGMTIVGWANLLPHAPNCGLPGRFARRVFWLKPGSDPYPGRCLPCEAVDPLAVAPGVPGRVTPRCTAVEGFSRRSGTR